MLLPDQLHAIELARPFLLWDCSVVQEAPYANIMYLSLRACDLCFQLVKEYYEVLLPGLTMACLLDTLFSAAYSDSWLQFFFHLLQVQALGFKPWITPTICIHPYLWYVLSFGPDSNTYGQDIWVRTGASDYQPNLHTWHTWCLQQGLKPGLPQSSSG